MTIIQLVGLLLAVVVIVVMAGPYALMTVCPKCERWIWKKAKQCRYCNNKL